ncbi:MAG: hypothetical protein ACOY9Y_10955 [Bacillota bacterium]
MIKKLTVETRDKLPRTGGIMMKFSLTDVKPKTAKGKELEKDRKLLIIEDKGNTL